MTDTLPFRTRDALREGYVDGHYYGATVARREDGKIEVLVNLDEDRFMCAGAAIGHYLRNYGVGLTFMGETCVSPGRMYRLVFTTNTNQGDNQ